MSQETLGSAKHLCRLMREIGSYMPHPVVVVTAEAPPSHHIKPDPPVESGSQEVQTITSERKGITIGSFTTLSLSPYPLITFNIKRPSATLQAIQQSKKFSVHLLRGNEHGAQFAVDFSEKTRTKHGGDEERERRMQRLFDGKRTGGGNGIMGILECECEGEVIVKDHSILIGRVYKTHGAVNSLYTTWAGNYERRRVAQRIMPGGLSYMKREYRMVGRKVYPPQGRMHLNQEEDHLTEETPSSEETLKKEMMLLKQLSKEGTPSQEEDGPSNKEEDRLAEEPPSSEDTPSSEEQTLLPEKREDSLKRRINNHPRFPPTDTLDQEYNQDPTNG